MVILRHGNRGAEVAALQRQLNLAGFDLPTTGYYGDMTRAAVQVIQRRNGLTTDGIAGDDTFRALGIAQAAHQAGIPPATTAQAYAAAPPMPGGEAHALNGDTLPPREGNDGRYRLVTVNGEARRGSRSNYVESQIALVHPDGHTVMSVPFSSGGWGRGALPGMDPSTYRTDMSDHPIIAEYTIDYAGSSLRSRRANPTFAYANGEGGYFLHLQNPDRATMRAIGGAGRSEFGIHPGGERLTRRGAEPFSEGCMKILDDEEARNFWQTIQSLSRNQRPEKLEIVNRDFVGRDVQMALRAEQPTVPRAQSQPGFETASASQPADGWLPPLSPPVRLPTAHDILGF